MDPQPLHPAIVEYEGGRAAKQRIALCAMGVIVLAMVALGVWMIATSHQQYPGGVEAWVGTAFGAVFALLGLLTSITAVEVLWRIGRLSAPGRVLLLLDAVGVTGIDGQPVAWADIAGIEAVADEPPARRTNRVAQLDAGHRAALGVKRSLDRSIGDRLGVRDGKRWVRVLLHDGTDRWTQLTLPVGPQRFEAVVAAIGEHAERQRVPFVGPR